MSDFAQSGLISTLQQLNAAHLPALESELLTLCARRPITLILPCHGPDLERPALAHIVAELQGADFIDQILVSINGNDPGIPALAAKVFAPLSRKLRILWNDSPATAELLAGYTPGKGLNVWAALGLVHAQNRDGIVVLQDCDVSSFRRSQLARLCYACAHPQLGYSFAKAYYSRATDKLYGRVSRLFFAPLLHALVRLCGHQPLLDFLLSFRYPLAGECAMTTAVAASLPLSSGWGLETGMLCELFRRVDPRAVAQVDGGSGYDHKHQSAEGALTGMSSEIARSLFAHLAEEGLSINAAFFETVAEAYRREAALAVRRSANLALINGLPFDDCAEQAIVETFAAQIHPLAPDSPATALPGWSTLARTSPAWVAEFLLRSARL